MFELKLNFTQQITKQYLFRLEKSMLLGDIFRAGIIFFLWWDGRWDGRVMG